MSRPSAPCSPFRRFWLPVFLATLAMLGCVKKETGSTLYLYDSGSSAVVTWENVDKVYEAAKEGKPVPAADRTIHYKEFKNMTLEFRVAAGSAVQPRPGRGIQWPGRRPGHPGNLEKPQ